MSIVFSPGDLLIYFKSDVAYIVLLDEVDEDYFTIVTSDDGIYQYGYKIRIRNLTDKYFLRLDRGFQLTVGAWEAYEKDKNTPPQLLIKFLENPNSIFSV